jgi:hypothetical protein
MKGSIRHSSFIMSRGFMVALRRYLVVAAFCFWQGGFTFYASVVVPVGQEVFGHLDQGFITRQVTFFLNLSGVIACLILAWDLFGSGGQRGSGQVGRIALWLVLVGALAVLFRMHSQLDRLLDLDALVVADPGAFHPLHRLYLWVSTMQWAAALVYLALTLRTWRAEDREEAVGDRNEESAKKSAEALAIPR